MISKIFHYFGKMIFYFSSLPNPHLVKLTQVHSVVLFVCLSKDKLPSCKCNYWPTDSGTDIVFLWIIHRWCSTCQFFSLSLLTLDKSLPPGTDKANLCPGNNIPVFRETVASCSGGILVPNPVGLGPQTRIYRWKISGAGGPVSLKFSLRDDLSLTISVQLLVVKTWNKNA